MIKLFLKKISKISFEAEERWVIFYRPDLTFLSPSLSQSKSKMKISFNSQFQERAKIIRKNNPSSSYKSKQANKLGITLNFQTLGRNPNDEAKYLERKIITTIQLLVKNLRSSRFFYKIPKTKKINTISLNHRMMKPNLWHENSLFKKYPKDWKEASKSKRRKPHSTPYPIIIDPIIFSIKYLKRPQWSTKLKTLFL